MSARTGTPQCELCDSTPHSMLYAADEMTATLKIRERMSALTHTVGRDQTMSEAAHRMHEFSIRHLAVLHGGTMIGIVSDRDIALVESLPGVDASVVQVHEAMTPDPYSVTVDAPLAGVVQTMADHKYGAALVVDKGDLVGIFTTTDALRLAHDLLAEAGAPAA